MSVKNQKSINTLRTIFSIQFEYGLQPVKAQLIIRLTIIANGNCPIRQYFGVLELYRTIGLAGKDNHWREYLTRRIDSFDSYNLFPIPRLYEAWARAFIGLGNYFCSSNYTYREARFVKIINILICDALLFNYISYELEPFLYFA